MVSLLLIRQLERSRHRPREQSLNAGFEEIWAKRIFDTALKAYMSVEMHQKHVTEKCYSVNVRHKDQSPEECPDQDMTARSSTAERSHLEWRRSVQSTGRQSRCCSCRRNLRTNLQLVRCDVETETLSLASLTDKHTQVTQVNR